MNLFLPLEQNCPSEELSLWRIERIMSWRSQFSSDDRTIKSACAIFIITCPFSDSYLVTIMGLVIPWSITLVLVDVYSVFVKFLPHQPRILSAIVIGDWVCSVFFSLKLTVFKKRKCELYITTWLYHRLYHFYL